jgi:hypothetical protein
LLLREEPFNPGTLNVRVKIDTFQLVAFVGFFLFVGFLGALILVALEGEKLFRHRQIGFDPAKLTLLLAAVLVLVAITLALLGARTDG